MSIKRPETVFFIADHDDFMEDVIIIRSKENFMKTIHRKRRRIRWGRVFLFPTLILFLVFALMTLKYKQDQNILQLINDKIVEMQNQLEEYLNSHKDDALIEKIILEANALCEGYAYEEALVLLKQDSKLQDDSRIKERIAYFQSAFLYKQR